eukprot:TRINITY_DN11476_c0_g2_i1.p1 TRINITY_DN11476_c0_g2~~TRINITY_DN11476_c0_g2_i1.p1  ORF type:complete len:244 (+),score=23.55 TRINITY_DN11476_c0_g2_i1:48-779(+)
MTREYVSPEGLRLDGRRPAELRRIRCKMGVISRPEGSAYFEQGNTKVLASVFGPKEVTFRKQARHDKAVLTCEFRVAPFSTIEHKERTKGTRKHLEYALMIKRSFESAIMTDLFPNSQVDIFIEVLQSDGGTLCAAINAVTLAVIDAGLPMRDFVVACSTGYVAGIPLLDLNFSEGGAGGPDLPLAILPKLKKITLIQMDSKLPLEAFEKVMQLGMAGCDMIYQVLLTEVKARTLEFKTVRNM